VINDFFSKKTAEEIVIKYGKFQVFTGSNVFAHIDNIGEIIE
jgi:hypothetical protein